MSKNMTELHIDPIGKITVTNKQTEESVTFNGKLCADSLSEIEINQDLHIDFVPENPSKPLVQYLRSAFEGFSIRPSSKEEAAKTICQYLKEKISEESRKNNSYIQIGDYDFSESDIEEFINNSIAMGGIADASERIN